MNVSKTKLLEMTKAKMMDYYNELTPTQQEQFKDFPQQIQQVKNNREAIEITRPIYLLVQQNNFKSIMQKEEDSNHE